VTVTKAGFDDNFDARMHLLFVSLNNIEELLLPGPEIVPKLLSQIDYTTARGWPNVAMLLRVVDFLSASLL
jgi:hypothetical protein